MKPQQAKGKNPYLEQVYTAHCLDGAKQVVVRFQAGAPDKDSLVWVSCNCGFWCFTTEYAVAATGSTNIIFSNGQPPYVRNPKRVPYLCKHLFAVGSRLKPGKKRDAAADEPDQYMEDAKHLGLLLLSRASSTEELLEQDLADVVPLHVIREVLSDLRRSGFVRVEGADYHITTEGLHHLLTL